mgnify:CR=1 FL=1
MLSFLENGIEILTNIMRLFGPLAAFSIVAAMSIFPLLPLAAFIAINMIVFGPLVGFLISWLGTVVGCAVSFYAFRKGFSDKLYKHIKLDGKPNKFIKYMNNMTFPNLALLMALPFTPAFLLNIAAGLSKVSFKKFLGAIIIGKMSIVYFWGYVGTSLIDSIRNPAILFELFVMMSIVYVLSLLMQKKSKIN